MLRISYLIHYWKENPPRTGGASGVSGYTLDSGLGRHIYTTHMYMSDYSAWRSCAFTHTADKLNKVPWKFCKKSSASGGVSHLVFVLSHLTLTWCRSVFPKMASRTKKKLRQKISKFQASKLCREFLPKKLKCRFWTFARLWPAHAFGTVLEGNFTVSSVWTVVTDSFFQVCSKRKNYC